jgi:hypothetical protein
MLMSAQQNNLSGGSPDHSTKFFKPFGRGKLGDTKESREADQHAFIDDLKKKNLIMAGNVNSKYK